MSPNRLLQTPMAPPGGHSKRIPPPWPAAGCPAALVSKATALMLLMCTGTLDSASGFAGHTFSASARQQLRRYRPSCDPSFGRRRGGVPLSAGPSSTPTPPKRPSPNKKGTGSVKFKGGRVTRPVEQAKGEDDEEEDVRKKSARWGVKPPSPPKLPSIPDVRSLKNPLDGVGKSLRKVRDCVVCACGAIT